MMQLKHIYFTFLILFSLSCAHIKSDSSIEPSAPPDITIEPVKLTYLEYPGTQPVIDDFAYLSGIKFLLPVPNVGLPVRSSLLPNAPRKYRNGIHRGIDFQANYGTPVFSVADGVVIRADHNYQEVSSSFRESLLQEATLIGRTPSDIFDQILLGKSIFIDHGTALVPGKRIVSIYAHLSDINPNIQVGKEVKRGQEIGRSGNSGTSEATKGSQKGAHLHFELIIQDAQGERYVGQGLSNDDLTTLLHSIFEEN